MLKMAREISIAPCRVNISIGPFRIATLPGFSCAPKRRLLGKDRATWLAFRRHCEAYEHKTPSGRRSFADMRSSHRSGGEPDANSGAHRSDAADPRRICRTPAIPLVGMGFEEWMD